MFKTNLKCVNQNSLLCISRSVNSLQALILGTCLEPLSSSLSHQDGHGLAWLSTFLRRLGRPFPSVILLFGILYIGGLLFSGVQQSPYLESWMTHQISRILCKVPLTAWVLLMLEGQGQNVSFCLSLVTFSAMVLNFSGWTPRKEEWLHQY